LVLVHDEGGIVLRVEDARRARVSGGTCSKLSCKVHSSTRVEEIAFVVSSVDESLKNSSSSMDVLLHDSTNCTIVSTVDGICKISLESSTSKVVNKGDQRIKLVLIEGSLDVVLHAILVRSNVSSKKILTLLFGKTLSRFILVVSDQMSNANRGITDWIFVPAWNNSLPSSDEINTGLSNVGWFAVGVARSTCWSRWRRGCRTCG
jgi:hypothetical protein